MTAEQFLDNDLNGTHQVYDKTGVTLISGIEHSEICRIMDEYAKAYHTKQLEAMKPPRCEHKNKIWVEKITEHYCPSCREIL